MLTARDLRTLATRGIDADDARRQLELLRHPPPPLRLLRPQIIPTERTEAVTPSEPVISYEPRRVPAAKAIVSSSPSLETSGPPYSCFLGPDSTR